MVYDLREGRMKKRRWMIKTKKRKRSTMIKVMIKKKGRKRMGDYISVRE